MSVPFMGRTFLFSPQHILPEPPSKEAQLVKGEHMNPSSEPNELQEVHLQEADIKALNETSLPAGQVIAEQNKEAEEPLAPRFVP
jgi:hypothetical protein